MHPRVPVGKFCLNDVFNPGPLLSSFLLCLLLQFQELPATFQADNRKVFFMLSVREEDGKYLRFYFQK